MAKKRSGPDPKRVQARAAIKAAAKRRQRNRLVAGVTALAVIALAVFAFSGGGGKNNASTTDTTAAAAGASAAGKACVAVKGPLPPGAPAVPVKTGKPPTTLVKQDLKQGTGAEVKLSDTLTVNYIGVSCSTGKIFDSSYKGGQPATFPLSGVIPGWQQGIPGMKVGGQRLLGIPPDLGYGSRGAGADIAPGETLWFVVEVLEAKAA
jgi:FKBP-type peptidyl-prolyl cis-trans isomerase